MIRSDTLKPVESRAIQMAVEIPLLVASACVLETLVDSFHSHQNSTAAYYSGQPDLTKPAQPFPRVDLDLPEDQTPPWSGYHWLPEGN